MSSETKKAKVALVLTGHMRCWEQVYPNIKKNFIDPYDTDVFISTWDDEGYWTSPENDPKGVGINTASPKLNIERVKEIYNPIKLYIDSNEEYRETYDHQAKILEPYCKQIRPLNILCQFDRIYNGYADMLSIGKEYDWVVRTRPDLIINSGLPNLNTTPKDFVFTLHHPNHEGLGTGDMLLISSLNFAYYFGLGHISPPSDANTKNLLVNGRFCPHIYTKHVIKKLCEELNHKHVELRVDKYLMHTPRGQYQDVPNPIQQPVKFDPIKDAQSLVPPTGEIFSLRPNFSSKKDVPNG